MRFRTPAITDTPLVYEHIAWKSYAASVRGRRHGRFRQTYERGVFEIVNCSMSHHWLRKILNQVICMASLELGVPAKTMGHTVLASAERQTGIEPDESYFVARERQMRSIESYDVEIDPPPDLALEINVAGSTLNRMRMYRMFGVPEVWRLAEDRLRFFRLSKGRYVEIGRSDAFPAIVPGGVEQLVRRRYELGPIPLVREFVRRLRRTVRARRT